jgi:hypothetical protein
MPTTLFTAMHVLTADAAVLPPLFSGTALAPAIVVLGRCRWWRRKSSVESKPRQGRARAKKAPRSEVRRYNVLMAKIHNPQIHLLLPHQDRPSQASRTIQCITIPCRGRLESIVMADTLMDPTRSRPGKPSSTSSSVPVRLLQVARQSNLMGDYYCQPAYLAILHHPSCSLPYPERC